MRSAGCNRAGLTAIGVRMSTETWCEMPTVKFCYGRILGGAVFFYLTDLTNQKLYKMASYVTSSVILFFRNFKILYPQT